jgi:hypothetical protein
MQIVIEGKDRARTTSVSGVRFCLRFNQLKRLLLPTSSLSDIKYNGLLGNFCPLRNGPASSAMPMFHPLSSADIVCDPYSFDQGQGQP